MKKMHAQRGEEFMDRVVLLAASFSFLFPLS